MKSVAIIFGTLLALTQATPVASPQSEVASPNVDVDGMINLEKRQTPPFQVGCGGGLFPTRYGQLVVDYVRGEPRCAMPRRRCERQFCFNNVALSLCNDADISDREVPCADVAAGAQEVLERCNAGGGSATGGRAASFLGWSVRLENTPC